MKDSVKQGWVEKPLGEISTLQRGFDLPKKLREPGEFPLVTSSGPTDTHSEAKVKGPGVATGRSGSIGNVFFVEEDFWPLNTALYVKDFHGNDPRFVYYLLNYVDLGRFASGAGVPTLNRNDVHGELYRIPSDIEEQQRIVAVLDEAFEGLARARAHAEANLQNARELFGSALVEALHSRKSDWRTLSVADTLTRTKVPAKIQRKAYLAEGLFPIVSQEAGLVNGYWNNEDDVIHLTRPVVVFGDHTRVLKYVDFDFVVGADGTQIMAPVECLEPRYYYYALKTIDLEGKGYARHFSHLKKCEISFPTSIETQRGIASQLDDLSANTQRLEEQYVRTLQDLEDLRQSLLQKAFAGELT
ncbi:restriction endonuclease subunit S [Roseovarius pacificus]|uniref:restriction endonuclease subunit S n=1 Tax=Roseovarius pacificus TaxID=337701 RepID=UPI00403A2D6A